MAKVEHFKLNLAIEIIKKLGFPIFSIDIEKDERDKCSSFFIYLEKGKIHRGENFGQYTREFILSFISKGDEVEEEPFDIIQLIENLKKTGLYFRTSEIDFGKLAETGEDAMMISLTFVRLIKVCD